MRHGVKWTVLGMALILALGARCAAAATYVLECNAMKQGKITAVLSSYQLEISTPLHPQNGLQSGLPHTVLVIHMPAQRAYTAILQATDTNEIMTTCKLTETESGGAALRNPNNATPPVQSLEWTFSELSLANTIVTGSDGSGTNGSTPQGSLQVTLYPKTYSFKVNP